MFNWSHLRVNSDLLQDHSTPSYHGALWGWPCRVWWREFQLQIILQLLIKDIEQIAQVIEYTRRVDEDSARSGASSNALSVDKTDQLGRKNANIRSRMAELDAEVDGFRQQIALIENQISICLHEKETLAKQLEQSRNLRDPKGKGKATTGINYSTEEFEWSGFLKTRMKAVFGIDNFRLCQKGWVFLSTIDVWCW